MSNSLPTNRLRERVASGLTRVLMGLYLFIGATMIANIVCAFFGAGG